MPTPVVNYLVRPLDSVRSVMGVIDRTRGGVALVVDDEGKLRGTITDGNIRRYVLNNGDVALSCASLLEKQPVTALIGSSRAHIRQIMQANRLLHLPLVDSEGKPHELWELRDFMATSEVPLVSSWGGPAVAVIMAGGEGKRLRPLTDTVPKPMLEIQGQPVLEQIVKNCVEAGVSTIYLAVHYRAEVIEDYFRNGEQFGVEIHYLREPKKLGTAGALTLLPEIISGPVLLMNGDVVTQVAYRRLLDWHYEHGSALTIAAVEYTTQVPYGVLECDGHKVVGITEKPEHTFLCGAGMYVLEAAVRQLLPTDTAVDMNQVITSAVKAGLAVSAFPLHEQWFDIGRHADLQRAEILWGTVA